MNQSEIQRDTKRESTAVGREETEGESRTPVVAINRSVVYF